MPLIAFFIYTLIYIAIHFNVDIKDTTVSVTAECKIEFHYIVIVVIKTCATTTESRKESVTKIV